MTASSTPSLSARIVTILLLLWLQISSATAQCCTNKPVIRNGNFAQGSTGWTWANKYGTANPVSIRGICRQTNPDSGCFYQSTPGTLSQTGVQVCGGGLYEISAFVRQFAPATYSPNIVTIQFCLGDYACGDFHWMHPLAPPSSGIYAIQSSLVYVPCGRGGTVTFQIKMGPLTPQSLGIAIDDVEIREATGGVKCGC